MFVNLVIAICLAVLAYWVVTPLIGLPVLLGVLIAIVVFLATYGGPTYYSRRGNRL